MRINGRKEYFRTDWSYRHGGINRLMRGLKKKSGNRWKAASCPFHRSHAAVTTNRSTRFLFESWNRKGQAGRQDVGFYNKVYALYWRTHKAEWEKCEAIVYKRKVIDESN